MAVGIVICLEAVDIDHQKAERRVFPGAACGLTGESFVEGPAIDHAGEPIGLGQILQLLRRQPERDFRLLRRSDVRDNGHRRAVFRKPCPDAAPVAVVKLNLFVLVAVQGSTGGLDPLFAVIVRNTGPLACFGDAAKNVADMRANHAGVSGQRKRGAILFVTENKKTLAVVHRDTIGHA